MKQPTLTVNVTRLSDIETGIWCDACLLPSAVGCLVGFSDDRGAILGVSSIAACQDCGKRVTR